MSNDSLKNNDDTPKEMAVPVHVQCEGYRCMAYRDKAGAWIDYQDRKPIMGSVQIIEYKPY